MNLKRVATGKILRQIQSHFLLAIFRHRKGRSLNIRSPYGSTRLFLFERWNGSGPPIKGDRRFPADSVATLSPGRCKDRGREELSKEG